MRSFRPDDISRQAYIRRKLRAQRQRLGFAAATGRLVTEGSILGADIFRHFLLLVGAGGLVAIAAGATTDCNIYWAILDRVSSLFTCFVR